MTCARRDTGLTPRRSDMVRAFAVRIRFHQTIAQVYADGMPAGRGVMANGFLPSSAMAAVPSGVGYDNGAKSDNKYKLGKHNKKQRGTN